MLNINYMKSFRSILLTVIILRLMCTFIACDRATSEDRRRINVVKDQYGEFVDISLEEEIYVKLKDRSPHDGGIKEDIAKDIYKIFFFLHPDREALRATAYFYLNVYNSNGKFEYQIHYNSRTKKFGKSFAEYY